MFILFLNVHFRKIILIEDPGKTLTLDGPSSLGKWPLQKKNTFNEASSTYETNQSVNAYLKCAG